MDIEQEEKRKRADRLLERFGTAQRGKLTVFLGAAAGVGKTYAMLLAAHRKQSEGCDIVIGFALSHGREETQALLQGLECIPEKAVAYKEKILYEINLPAILERKPEIVIIDELAHSNTPGSAYAFRYQEVEELLAAGIDVYTAVNIQHIESLHDVVAQITGVFVRETVPDSFFEQASDIQVIDIPPKELRRRMEEGKIYRPEQAAKALTGFFREGNIYALRELTLRFAAANVEKSTAAYRRRHHIEGPWPTSGKVLVCVGASPFSAQLLRSGHRLAAGLHSELIALHVETRNSPYPIGDRERERVWKNLKLAEELGARIVNVSDDDVVHAIVSTAKEYNVNAIVMGKPEPKTWRNRFRAGLVDKVIAQSGLIHVYVMQALEEKEQDMDIVPTKTGTCWHEKLLSRETLLGIAMTAGITAAAILLRPQLHLLNIALLYLLPILGAALWWGKTASSCTTAAAILLFDYFFISPMETFAVSDLRYVWSFFLYFAVAYGVGKRTDTLKQEVQTARRRERNLNRLYQFSVDMTAVEDRDTLTRSFARHAAKSLNRDVCVFFPENEGRLTCRLCCTGQGEIREIPLEEAEQAASHWSFTHGKKAGHGTNTLPMAAQIYFPLLYKGEKKGVVGIRIKQAPFSTEERILTEAWLGLFSLMVQRIELFQQARQAQILKESDTLRSALFNSVSHELKTPLAMMMGAAYSLEDKKIEKTPELCEQLLSSILDSGRRMERIIANLLDTARIESGTFALKKEWTDMEDLVSGALRRLGGRIQERILSCALPEDLPLFMGDGRLLEHVVLNLLDNAVKYSEKGTAIFLRAWHDERHIYFAVEDEGIGFKEDDEPYLFEKFYRAAYTDQIQGTGLGLSICKNIVEAHGGSIWAARRTDRQGSQFGFSLPLETEDEV